MGKKYNMSGSIKDMEEGFLTKPKEYKHYTIKKLYILREIDYIQK